MKKYILISCFLFSFFPAWAQNSLEVAYEISNYTYKEPDGGTPISLKGYMQGANAIFKHRFVDNNMFWAADMRYMGGATDYDGWLMSTPPTKHTTDDIGDYYLEGRLLAGSIYTLSEQWELWAFMGLGYRYLKDHMNKSPFGYLRKSHYLYVPAAVEFHWTSGSWAAALNAELDFLLRGVQNSRFADIDPAYSNPTNDQNRGLGLRLSAKLSKDLGRMSVFIEPFWRYWDIEDSDTTLLYYNGLPYEYVLEPHNTTTEYGLRAGINF